MNSITLDHKLNSFGMTNVSRDFSLLRL